MKHLNAAGDIICGNVVTDRTSFLNVYDKGDFDKLENSLYVWYGPDYLNFATEKASFHGLCDTLKLIVDKLFAAF